MFGVRCEYDCRKLLQQKSLNIWLPKWSSLLRGNDAFLPCLCWRNNWSWVLHKKSRDMGMPRTWATTSMLQGNEVFLPCLCLRNNWSWVLQTKSRAMGMPRTWETTIMLQGNDAFLPCLRLRNHWSWVLQTKSRAMGLPRTWETTLMLRSLDCWMSSMCCKQDGRIVLHLESLNRRLSYFTSMLHGYDTFLPRLCSRHHCCWVLRSKSGSMGLPKQRRASHVLYGNDSKLYFMLKEYFCWTIMQRRPYNNGLLKIWILADIIQI